MKKSLGEKTGQSCQTVPGLEHAKSLAVEVVL